MMHKSNNDQKEWPKSNINDQKEWPKSNNDQKEWTKRTYMMHKSIPRFFN